MQPETLLHNIIAPALRLLPPALDIHEACAMLVGIALQESELRARVQVLDAGKPWWKSRPGAAHGLWQFERDGGVTVVLGNPKTRALVDPVLAELCYPPDATIIHDALIHNDLLACVFARALLYSAPWPLPKRGDDAESWRQYQWCWRPGKPKEHKWEANYSRAWRTIA